MELYHISYREVLEREIVLTSVIAAEPEAVFAAFSTREALEKWFGPLGFSVKTYEFDFRIGGQWRFEFKSPDGTLYGNRIQYVTIRPVSQIAFFHGEDKDNDPKRFLVTITFDAQQNKKTVISLRQLHPTPEQRQTTIGFGAVEYGMQTMDKLAEYLVS